MSGLDAAGFTAYARQQVRAADAILRRHHDQGTTCSCGRTTPCAQALAVRRRRSYFAGRLAQLAPPERARTTSSEHGRLGAGRAAPPSARRYGCRPCDR